MQLPQQLTPMPNCLPMMDHRSPTPLITRVLSAHCSTLPSPQMDLSYALQQVCLYMHTPREPHLALVKHILHYVKSTLDYGLHICVSDPCSITAYSDVDWVGCPDTQRWTSSYYVFFGDNMISCSSKCQTTVSRSSVEAKYRAVAHVAAECC
jgi:hypothetical protein